MELSRRMFLKKTAIAVGTSAVVTKIVETNPLLPQDVKQNHAELIGIQWWYKIKPPVQFTDDGFLLHGGHDETLCLGDALPYYLKKGWYIVGQPIRGRVER